MLETALQNLPGYLSPVVLLIFGQLIIRRTVRETESTLVTAANSMVLSQHNETEYWRNEVAELRQRVEELEAELRQLRKQE